MRSSRRRKRAPVTCSRSSIGGRSRFTRRVRTGRRATFGTGGSTVSTCTATGCGCGSKVPCLWSPRSRARRCRSLGSPPARRCGWRSRRRRSPSTRPSISARMAKRVPMASIDAAWLGMEDPTNLMMVTGVLALTGPVDRKRLRLLLDRRLRPFRRFHQKVVRPRSRGSLPHWQDDEQFEIDNHVSHVRLPPPGGDAALRDMVTDLMSVPLDFSKPLWHIHVIDGYKAGSVVLARVHHSIADGIALVRGMLWLTDESPNPQPTRAPTKALDPGFGLPLDWVSDAVCRGLAG